MFDNAFSSGQIHGYVAGPFPIKRFITQGCPMSMLLFALVLNPLICLLKPHRRGVIIGHWTKKTSVMAYSADIIIFVMSHAEI